MSFVLCHLRNISNIQKSIKYKNVIICHYYVIDIDMLFEIRMSCRMRKIVIVAALLGCIGFASITHAGEGDKCAVAGAAVETTMALPAGLLAAIGRIESGRRDTQTGAVLPWPWSINAAGRDEVYQDADQAIRRTRTLIGQGVASIDIGCFQINLAAHPTMFVSLDDGFDPAANARAAGRLLLQLRAQLGSWPPAIAAYHSSTPSLGGPYRDRVLAAWGRTDFETVATPVPESNTPPGLREIVWYPTCCIVKVWTPTPQAGPNVIVISPGNAATSVRSASR